MCFDDGTLCCGDGTLCFGDSTLFFDDDTLCFDDVTPCCGGTLCVDDGTMCCGDGRAVVMAPCAVVMAHIRHFCWFPVLSGASVGVRLVEVEGENVGGVEAF